MVTLAPTPRSLTPSNRVAAASVRTPLAGFDDSDEFHVVQNVPVFPEHQTQSRDGRWLVFDYANLKKVCDNCNRRIAATGDYAAITIGHTADPAAVRAGKAKNPAIVGFAGPFRMGLLGRPGFQRWCILAVFRIFRDKWAEVRTYPRRSPELWLMPTYEEMFLDPIALLGAETPRIDMGLLYAAELHGSPVLVEKYAAVATAPSAANVFVPSERYQGETNMSASADEVAASVVNALDGLDWVQWVKQKMQQETSAAAAGTAPAADVNAPPAPAPVDGAAGGPPGTEGDAPAAPGTPPGSDPAAAPPTGDPAAAPAAPPAAPIPPPGIPPAAAAAPAAAAPAGAPAAAPPLETRSDAEPEKDSAGGNVPRVKYQADPEPEAEGGDPEVNEPPPGTLVEDPEATAEGDDDDDDVEPMEGENVEQYRARSRDHRRRRRTARVKYAADETMRQTLAAVVAGALQPMAARLDAIDATQKELHTRVNADRAGVKNIERYARLETLARQGYAINPAEMIETLKYSASGDGVSDDEFERSFALLVKTGNRAPIDAPLPPSFDGTEMYSADRPGGAAERLKVTDEHRNKAREICEKAAVNGQPADYVRTLTDVATGKL
jgi:hypothetical protein